MLFDWDDILITVLNDDGIVTKDEYSYSLEAEQRMITFAGNKGDKGDKGDAATIQVGTVTTLPAGSPATVQNAGTQNDAIFNFGIPQGQQGVPGSDVWGAITGTLSDQTDLQNALNAKQNTLTFDNTPTDGSNNPVTSDGIYDALAAKQNTLTFDNVPTDGSNNPVKSDGIYDALTPKTNLSVVAGDFSTSTAYAIDDTVIYQGVLYRFISAHSAGAWNSAHVTACTIMEVMRTFSNFYVTGTASAGSSITITDSRIDSNHWRVPNNGIYFSDSSKVTTRVHWVTNPTNHTVTLEATFTGSTDVKIDLEWYQNAS